MAGRLARARAAAALPELRRRRHGRPEVEALSPTEVKLNDAFEKALGRELKGYVILGACTGVLLVFEGGLGVELRSTREIEATETDPTGPIDSSA